MQDGQEDPAALGWEQVDLESVARHEAGHVVIRYLKGYKATAVRVHSDGSGYVEPGGARERWYPWDLLDLNLAGWAAEYGLALFLPEVEEAIIGLVQKIIREGTIREVSMANPHGVVTSDYEEAITLLTKYPDLVSRSSTVEEAILKKLQNLAEYDLHHHEHLVEAITSALLERHELTAREVAALLREAAKRTRYSAPSREG